MTLAVAAIFGRLVLNLAVALLIAFILHHVGAR